MDKRGDIGLVVREAGMQIIISLLKLAVELKQQISEKCIQNVIGLILQ